jgi:hypothetical protein
MILVINNLFSQNKLKGLVLDYETKKPVEYVDIFNKTNFTSTNSDGEFLFVSEQDSIKIRLLGYKTIYSTFKEVKNDTIFLESKFETLDEIILGNSNSIKNIYKEIYKNYPFTPYSELFFLRCLIKKDGEIIKLQDLNGIVKRKTLFSTSKIPMPKRNYEIEVLNMRKAGIDEKDVYFKMFSFKQILDLTTSITLDTKSFNFRKKKSENEEYTKYYFSPKSKKKSTIEGHYLVNNNNKAIIEFQSKRTNSNSSFTEKRGIKYKTTSFQLFVSFKKNISDSKYFLDKAKIKAQLELINEDKKIIYNVVYSWIRLEKTIKKINKKTSIKKDIFKLKTSYKPKFWNKQRYLLLTNEMSEFLIKLENSQKEFKTITNIKKE